MNQGKYVFSQVMDFAPRYRFDRLVVKYRGHHRVKHFTCWEQFLAMAFGQLAHGESLRDIVVCLRAQQEKLYHLGFPNRVSRTNLARANKQRDWRIYRDLAGIIIREARRLYRHDPNGTIDLKGTVYVIDATTIDLCLGLFKWAAFRKTKGAIRLHTLMDLKGSIPTFFRITNGKVHEVNFLDVIGLERGAYYIMDRGFGDFARLYLLHRSGAFFITRAKGNLAFQRLYSNPVDKNLGLRCDQVITLSGFSVAKKYPEKIRRIKYLDQETGKYYVFLTNDLNIEAQTVADLYKNRWRIELFFKWIKQHLRIKSFWGYSPNAVKTQICIAICVYATVAIIKKKLNIDRNLYEILQILSVSLLAKIPLAKLFSEEQLQEFEVPPEKLALLWDD